MSLDDSKIPEGTLKMCPRYIEFLKKSQKDLINRYSKHNTYRSQCIKLCVDETLFELCNISQLSHLSSLKVPIFGEKEDILSASIREMKNIIYKTPTVQASKCKKIIKTYQQFTKKANNKQDQNSWKVSGEYFFVPYIYSFIEFIKKDYLSCVINKIPIEKEKIFELCGIIFALKLLKKKVKFERAKEKPLIRDRTLVNSSCLHYAFKKLNPKLNLPKFYLIEKAKRKKIKKKIISQKFHRNICQFAEYLFDNNNNNNNNNYNNYNDYDFPNDWIHQHVKKQREINTIQTESESESESENNRIFQSTANFNNLSNGIHKDLFCMDLIKINKNKNRKINQEIHIKQMRNMHMPTIIPNKLFINYNENKDKDKDKDSLFIFNHDNNIINPDMHNEGFKLKFDVAPTTINRIGSETIMNGEINTNDMGYSFNN